MATSLAGLVVGCFLAGLAWGYCEPVQYPPYTMGIHDARTCRDLGGVPTWQGDHYSTCQLWWQK